MKTNPLTLHVQIADSGRISESVNNLVPFFNSVISALSEKYQGDLVQSADYDGKIFFSKPENAFQFAVNLTSRFSQDPRVPCKIGIARRRNDRPDNQLKETAHHLSDICPEGAVLVSKEAMHVLDDPAKFNFKYIGDSLFEGLEEPVEIFALSGAHIYVPSRSELTKAPKKRNSIAVMPLHNTSSEKDLDYMCEGLAEEIIDSLTKSKSLFVTARTSSFLFANKGLSISEISRKLNVSYILDGSIRKRNDQYRISFQLVDCSTGYNVVSDTIESSFEQLYDTEKEITKTLISYFDGGEKEKVPGEVEQDNEYYIDPRAYSYYLQGRFYSTQWEVEPVKKAARYFEKALEIIPDYALAYAGLSITYTHMAINGFADFRESISRAVDFADKSIASDNSIPDGYISRAIATFWMGNWYLPDFESNITSALALSPCNAEIRMYNSMVFLMKGELNRSLSEILLSKELDPYSEGVNIRLGLIQYLNREYVNAYNTFLGLIRTEQHKTYNILRIAWCCIQMKQYNQALEYLEESAKDYEYYNMIYGIYLVVYHALKDDLKFFEYKAIIEGLPEGETCTHYNLATLHKLLGNQEKSIFHLEKTLQNPMFLFTFMQYDEFWEDYHENPLFKEVVTSKYSGMGNRLLTIKSETKETMEVNISDFLYAEAQDNYTLIAFKEKGRKLEKILRATLSYIEDQLNLAGIIRCHRSYMVNASAGFNFHKSDNRAILKHPELKIEIPVSRSKEKEIKELFNAASAN